MTLDLLSHFSRAPSPARSRRSPPKNKAARSESGTYFKILRRFGLEFPHPRVHDVLAALVVILGVQEPEILVHPPLRFSVKDRGCTMWPRVHARHHTPEVRITSCRRDAPVWVSGGPEVRPEEFQRYQLVITRTACVQPVVYLTSAAISFTSHAEGAEHTHLPFTRVGNIP